MGEFSPGVPPSQGPPEGRLDSWKEIAAYLNRDVTTVQRWEKREGMPVHRHLHDKRGSVYALHSELDAWLQTRSPRLEEEETEQDREQARELEAAQGTEQENARNFDAPVGARGNHVQHDVPRTQRWVAAAAILALVGLLAAAYGVFRSRIEDASHSKIKSLAVLPLKNLSGDPAQDYLADGMTEALIGRLAGIHDLRVISHTSVMRFKNPQISVPEIARTLGVDAIVEGSVMREGNRIRVTAQLIRGATDEHFWSETYDRELSDALPLESELAQTIAKKVEVTVSGKEHERLAAARPVAPEVYESYLKGWFAFNHGNSRADIEKSIGYFEDAKKRDPTFALAYLGLAEAYAELGTPYIGAPPEETRPKAKSAVRKALELDPELAEAHASLANAWMVEWHWADAETEFRRALELSPNNASAHIGLASWFLCNGRTVEALSWARRGRELDPFSVSGTDVGWILFQARRYDEAIHELRSELVVHPDDPGALWYLGFVLIANNEPGDAIPVLEKAASVSNRSPGVIGVLIRAYAHAGRRGDALRLLAELKNREKSVYVPAAAFVNAYLGLDENEQAFVWLEQAYKEQSNILLFLKVHPYFDPLRGDPRFADLVRRIGLA
jgi:TolB-like protein/Tfp pilus assembly protein PilF